MMGGHSNAEDDIIEYSQINFETRTYTSQHDWHILYFYYIMIVVSHI